MHAGAGSPRSSGASFPSLGPGQLRPGRDVDAIDGRGPQVVITPRGPADLLATIAEARAHGLGIVPSGGATQLQVGATPRRYDVKLSMTAIGNILEHNPEDMTVTCEAGVSLSRLQRALARHQQRVSLDLPREDRSTIGGVVATNAAGGLRHASGLPRDLLLGVTAVDGCGRTLQAGGRVVKNVAGYDLTRLLAGSRGSLAVLTSMTLRTHPLPEAAATLVFQVGGAAALEQARLLLQAEPMPLAAVDFSIEADGRGGQTWKLWLRLEGTEAEVAAQGDRACTVLDRDPVDAGEAWQSPAHAGDGDCMTWSIAASPSELARIAAETATQAAGSPHGRGLRVGGHLASGIARFQLPLSHGEASAIAEQPPLAAQPGPLVLFHALWERCGRDLGVRSRVLEQMPSGWKQGLDPWGASPASLPLMRALKQRFDPDGVLSPGRLPGGL